MNNKAIVNNFLPLPLAFNKPSNKLSLTVSPRSDTTILRVDFYEYHGVYWFNFDYYGRSMNSTAFVGLRNCVLCFKETVSSLRFSLSDPDLYKLRDFVRNWEKGLKVRKVVA